MAYHMRVQEPHGLSHACTGATWPITCVYRSHMAYHMRVLEPNGLSHALSRYASTDEFTYQIYFVGSIDVTLCYFVYDSYCVYDSQ
jgi:hypothetical protein